MWLLWSLACYSTQEPPDQAGRWSNFLLISVDTVRRDFLSRYGDVDSTPFLAELAEESLVMDRHQSCSNWTYGSMACLLGGRDGVELGFVPRGEYPIQQIPDDIDLLPNWLAVRGMKTTLVTTNPYVGQSSGMDHDYEVFIEDFTANAERMVDMGLEQVERLENSRRPWFLHLHLFDPHHGYAPPEEYLTELEGLPELNYDLTRGPDLMTLEDDWESLSVEEREAIYEQLMIRYHGELEFVDAELERLFKTLESQGVLEDTLIWMGSDHGEQFFEHAGLTHGRSLHHHEVDAFSMFWGRDLEPGIIQEPTSHADLSPMILDLLSKEQPPGFKGWSRTDLVSRRDLYKVRINDVTLQALDRDGWRMIYAWDGTLEVFDLEVDPGEQNNLLDPESELQQEMWRDLSHRVEELARMVDDSSPVWPHSMPRP